MQTMVNIEVVKGANENNLSVTKRVQAAGVLPRVRSKRYTLRIPSRNTRRAKTIDHIKKKEVTAELVKQGKIVEVTKFSRRR